MRQMLCLHLCTHHVAYQPCRVWLSAFFMFDGEKHNSSLYNTVNKLTTGLINNVNDSYNLPLTFWGQKAVNDVKHHALARITGAGIWYRIYGDGFWSVWRGQKYQRKLTVITPYIIIVNDEPQTVQPTFRSVLL